MASAMLELEEERNGQLVFRVGADPFDAPPFAGPAGRNWDAFVVHDASHAEFQWRTGADRERDRAKRLVRLGLLDDEVEGAFRRADYLQRVDEQLREWAEDDPDHAFDFDPDDDEARHRSILRDLALGFIQPEQYDGIHSFYGCEDDTHLGHAAEALELPEGGEVEEEDDGGPGSGYTACFIVLPPGMTLADYAAWLAARPVRTVRQLPTTPDRFVSWLKHVLVPVLGLKGGGGRVTGWEVGGFEQGVKLGFVGLAGGDTRVQLHAKDERFAEVWQQALLAWPDDERPVVATGQAADHVYLRFEWTRAGPDDFGPELERIERHAKALVAYARRAGLLSR